MTQITFTALNHEDQTACRQAFRNLAQQAEYAAYAGQTVPVPTFEAFVAEWAAGRGYK